MLRRAQITLEEPLGTRGLRARPIEVIDTFGRCRTVCRMSILMPDSRQARAYTGTEEGAQRLHELVAGRDEHDSKGRHGYARVLLNHARMRTTVTPQPHWLAEPVPNACFANSVAAVGHPQAVGLTYVEGYAYLGSVDFAFEHAWLEDEDSNVVETTWTKPGLAYFGIPMPLAQLHALVEIDDREPFVFGDWARGFPVLRAHAACCHMPWSARS